MTKSSKLIPTKPVVIIDMVKESKDWDKFKFLSGTNRDVDLKRAQAIAVSIALWGWQNFLTVIATRAFSDDGSLEYYIVDGQHRLFAVKQLRLPYNYIIVEFENEDDDSKENVVKYMAHLNSVSKTWCPMEYVKAYCSLNDPKFRDYLVFAKTMEQNSLIATTVLCLYTRLQSFKAASSFYDGGFTIENKKESREMLESLLDVRQYIPPLARVQTEFIEMVRQLKFNGKIENYSEVVTAVKGRMKSGGEDFPADKKEFKISFGKFLKKMF